MIEFHTTQDGTGIRPGNNVDLDYSLTRLFATRGDLRIQAGLVGYEARQTTDKNGPGLTPAESATRYEVNAVGFVACTSPVLPAHGHPGGHLFLSDSLAPGPKAPRSPRRGSFTYGTASQDVVLISEYR